MRILLTGGQGQVGWELRRTLAVLGEVVAPGRDALDLASAASIIAAVRTIRPEFIVNCAAYTAVDQAESEPDLAMRVNGHAPGILAEEARKAGAMLVHYSTDYVFDGSKAVPYVETDPVAPLNVYGRTKLAGEQAVLASGVAHLILRTSWVYAPRGRNFLLTVRRLGRERKELGIVDDQFGAPTSARMIAEATAHALAAYAIGGHKTGGSAELGGLYHLCAAGKTTWYEFATEILRGVEGAATVRPIPTAEYPTPARRPKYSLLDNSRFHKHFGFTLPDWRMGLQLCMEELRE